MMPDDPQRDRIAPVGDRFPQDPATYSERDIKMLRGQKAVTLEASILFMMKPDRFNTISSVVCCNAAHTAAES